MTYKVFKISSKCFDFSVFVVNIFENIYSSLIYVCKCGQEAIAVGRSFASIKGYHLDGNKEMVAMGCMNIVGSFTSCYTATGETFKIIDLISLIKFWFYGVVANFIMGQFL